MLHNLLHSHLILIPLEQAFGKGIGYQEVTKKRNLQNWFTWVNNYNRPRRLHRISKSRGPHTGLPEPFWPGRCHQWSITCLCSHPRGQLVLIPDGMKRTERSAGHEACPTCVAAQEKRGIKWMHSIHPETVGSQFCRVSVDDCFGLEFGGARKLNVADDRLPKVLPSCVWRLDSTLSTVSSHTANVQMSKVIQGCDFRFDLWHPRKFE